MATGTDLSPKPWLPEESSLAHRARLTRLLSPLRRVRPRVPFFQLAAHRIPTLWSLYRGLLRTAPTQDIRWRVKTLFRRYEHLTSPAATQEQLRKGHRWLDTFVKAKEGDNKLRMVLERYSRLIVAKRTNERLKIMIRDAFIQQEKMRRRPIMTGSYLRPSLSNRPLPRLKPQPESISMMIRKRRLARDRRLVKYALLTAWRADLRAEVEFEEMLHTSSDGAKFERVFAGYTDEWDEPLRSVQSTLRSTFALDIARQNTPYPPELLLRIKDARRRKIANKTLERLRERRGEVLRRTILRARQGPPAHILATMTPEQRRVDKIVRSPSESGYVGMLKRRKGMKLRDDVTWRLEDGREEERERLDKIAKEVWEENERRRIGVGKSDEVS